MTPTGAPEDALQVEGLSVSYRKGAGFVRVVDDVSFAVARGEVFGLVGESGCGKSTVALQILGYRSPLMRTDAGRVVFGGADVLALPRAALDRVRGAGIAFVPQNPTTALNPGIRVGAQIDEILAAHTEAAPAARMERVRTLFDLVGLPATDAAAAKYPHQMSGGQQQRVCIAMALACDPAFVVLDEPTTGLDVTTQRQIVDLLGDLRARLGMSMLYVTHDLGLLSQIADRVGVMYAGRMVEVAPVADIFTAPAHPYTRGLIGSLPRLDPDTAAPAARPLRGLLRRQDLPEGCPFAPRCEHAEPACARDRQPLEPTGTPGRSVACRRWREIAPEIPSSEVIDPAHGAGRSGQLLVLEGVRIAYGTGRRRFEAVRAIDLAIAEGETLALVGESGSGKSTIARAIAGLVAPEAGRITLAGAPLAGDVADRTTDQRRRIQYVFQNPDASLNPRARILEAIARPAAFFFGRRPDASAVARALDDVRLDPGYAARFPDELSGGERQRVAIARALAAEPALLMCDEVLSALDVSVQASVLELLRRLRAERGIAMLFISHDLAVVRMLADRVMVLFRGEVVETGPREAVFAPPFHPYSRSLIEAVPVPLRRRAGGAAGPDRLRPDVAEATRGPGCAYAGRCAVEIAGLCVGTPPPLRTAGPGHAIRCHHMLDDLSGARAHPPAGNTAQ
jgi:peptide/nickel transport system ATP-binding protein